MDCYWCRKPLTDATSVEVRAGARCVERFGLPPVGVPGSSQPRMTIAVFVATYTPKLVDAVLREQFDGNVPDESVVARTLLGRIRFEDSPLPPTWGFGGAVHDVDSGQTYVCLGSGYDWWMADAWEDDPVFRVPLVDHSSWVTDGAPAGSYRCAIPVSISATPIGEPHRPGESSREDDDYADHFLNLAAERLSEVDDATVRIAVSRMRDGSWEPLGWFDGSGLLVQATPLASWLPDLVFANE